MICTGSYYGTHQPTSEPGILRELKHGPCTASTKVNNESDKLVRIYDVVWDLGVLINRMISSSQLMSSHYPQLVHVLLPTRGLSVAVCDQFRKRIRSVRM